jgi:hypothetical protein
MREGSGCLGWIVAGVALWFLWQWFDNSGGRWTAWVYPNGANLTR